MMIKLQGLDCYLLQAFAVRYGGWHDWHKQPGSMAWLSKAAAVMPRRTATERSLGCSLPCFHRVPAEIDDGERQ